MRSEAEVIFAAGPAGRRIADARPRLKQAKRLMVVADVNAVPPAGVEGVGVNDNAKPIAGHEAVGIGALAVGNIKYKTEAGLFKEMIEGEEAGLSRLPGRLRSCPETRRLSGRRCCIAAISARSLAQSARRAGFTPLVADFFADTDTQEAAHACRKLAAASSAACDGEALRRALDALAERAPSPHRSAWSMAPASRIGPSC